MGLEPTRSCDHRHLKPARLPIPPLLHFFMLSVVQPTNVIITRTKENVNTFLKKI